MTPRALLAGLGLALALAFALPARAPSVAAAAAPEPDPRADRPGYWLQIARPGAYRVRLADLAAAGWSGGAVPRAAISLTWRGRAVPLWFEAADPGRLAQPDDAICFYARPETGPHSNSATFWLSFESGAGVGVERRTLLPASQTTPIARIDDAWQEDREYWLGLPEGAGRDHWFWNRLRAGEMTADAPFEVDLELGPEPEAGGELTLFLQGKTAGEHRMDVELNGAVLGGARWYEATPDTLRIAVTTGVLRVGSNRLRLTGGGGSLLDLAYLDRVELSYPGRLRAAGEPLTFRALPGPAGYTIELPEPGGDARLLDITDPWHPALLEGYSAAGGRLTFSDSLADRVYLLGHVATLPPPDSILAYVPEPLPPVREADDLVIADPLWRAGLTDLLAWHAARGRRVELVTPAAIYARFGFGEPTPEAIRAFLAFAWNSNSRTLRSVMLVGDATYDFRGRLGPLPPGSLPTRLIQAPSFGEVGSDNALADILGDDGIPDYAVGRLPCRSAAQLERFVARTLEYARAGDAPEPAWRRRVLLAADDGDALNAFEAELDDLAGRLPGALTVRRDYLRDLGSPERAREAIRQDLNAGALLAFYAGHGDVTTWGAERLLHVDDAAGLTNGAAAPFVVAMNCLNGYFIDREAPASLAEALLWSPTGGAVGVWAPAGLGYLSDERTLARGLLESLFGDGNRSIGAAIRHAQAHLVEAIGATAARELIADYTYFGDPTLELALPRPPTPAPPQPRGTTVGIWLTWPDASAMRVFRAEGAGDTALVAELPAGRRGWLDREARLGTTYAYALQAVDPGGLTGARSTAQSIEYRVEPGDGDGPAASFAGLLPCIDELDSVRVTVTDPDGVPCGRLHVAVDGTPLADSLLAGACDPGGIATTLRLAFAPPREPGTYLLRLDVEDGAGVGSGYEASVTVCGTLLVRSFSAGPNPTAADLLIDVQFNRPATLLTRIFDVNGRLIRSEAEPAAAHHVRRWDGRDATGRRVPGGLYFLRLDSHVPTRPETALPLVLIRKLVRLPRRRNRRNRPAPARGGVAGDTGRPGQMPRARSRRKALSRSPRPGT